MQYLLYSLFYLCVRKARVGITFYFVLFLCWAAFAHHDREFVFQGEKWIDRCGKGHRHCDRSRDYHDHMKKEAMKEAAFAGMITTIVIAVTVLEVAAGTIIVIVVSHGTRLCLAYMFGGAHTTGRISSQYC